MTLVTKKFTNQNRMKELKGIQKACQIKLKEVKGNADEMTKINKQMMECSMELMKHSFRPMLITFIPILLIFWWANANLAYFPIDSGEQFSITVILDKTASENVNIEAPKEFSVIGESEKPPTLDKGFFKSNKKVDFDLIAGERGAYLIKVIYEDEIASKNILISNLDYEKKSEMNKDWNMIEEIKINYYNTGFFNTYWLWTYISVSIVSSIILRKVFDVV